jgi:hypothetical protein
MSDEAIGWSDCELLSRKMGELQPLLLRYVVGRSGDDFEIQIKLLDLRYHIQQILDSKKRSEPTKPGKVIFPNWKNQLES